MTSGDSAVSSQKSMALLLMASAAAHAGSATSNLSVSAEVSANCTISTSPLGFAWYDPVVAHASTPLDAEGAVTMTCTQGTTATIGLNLGLHESGSTRRLTDTGTNYLTYEIYQDASRTIVWGSSGGDLLTPPAAPDSTPRTFTMYGRAAAGQNVPPGSYTDTVMAMLNF